MNSFFDDTWKECIIQGARDLGVPVTWDQASALMHHASEMLRWNGKTNITAIVDPMEMAVKHYVDSLALAPCLPQGARLLDIGTGGGFPGFPVKVVRPDLECVLIDASRKRISFLKSVIGALGIPGIQAIHTRAEDLAGTAGYQGRFQAVTSRALTSLEGFAGLALPFLDPAGGVILAMKGRDDIRELDRLTKGPWEVKVSPYRLMPGNHSRSMVRIRPCAPCLAMDNA